MTDQIKERRQGDGSAIWASGALSSKARSFILSASHNGDDIGAMAAASSLDPKVYLSAGALLGDLSYDAAAVICDEELLGEDDLADFHAWVLGQPAWSDLPFLILTENLDSEGRRRLLDTLGHVVFLPRSDVGALAEALQSALHSHLRRSSSRAAYAKQGADLVQSEKTVRTVFETSHQCQGLLGVDGEIIYANAVALDGIERQLDDVLGQPFCESPWFAETPGMLKVVRAAVLEVAAGRPVAMRMALRLPSGDKLYDFSMRPIFDDQGTVVAMVPEAVDVTAQTQAEDGLRQSQKMEAVGQLTGGVAHDFNNLLTVIKSCSELLVRPGLSEARRAHYIAAISETTDRAAQLTAQLLAFARRQALQPKVFNLSASVVGVSNMLETLCGSQIELVVELPETPCFVDADPSQFDTALVNMVLNARDAMGGAGRLVIRVECLDGIPAIRAHPPIHAPFVSVSVEDTGVGMRADIQDKIFEPFFTTKGLGEGTGLGLSQVFGFAKQSGGEVMVQSVLGEGSTFTLFLRQAGTPQATDPELSPDDLALELGCRVLVVEDNRDVGQFVTQSLEDMGYRSRWVGGAEAALAALADDPGAFDIVFTDVVMPGVDGLALAQEVRRLYPDTPVILSSGYSEILVRDRDHGFELLQKPYSAEQLSMVVRQAMARARLGSR